MEHLWVNVAEQHIVHKRRAYEVFDLRCAVTIERRLHWVVVDTRELRLIVIPVGGVEKNIVGMPRYLIDAWSIAVRKANVGRRISPVVVRRVGGSSHRSIGDHIAHSVS